MNQQAQTENPGRKSRAPAISLVLVMLAALGSGAYWLDGRGHAARAESSTDNGSADGVKSVLHLESFVVNLADPDQAAFLRVGIDLGIGPAPKGEVPTDKSSPVLPKIRDVILSVLTTSQSTDLLAAGGKAKLKERLLSALNQQIPDLPVKEVYFTEFLVQR